MKTAIISIGTEILFGQIINTNTVYLSQQLNLLGFDVLYHHTVGDNSGRLEELINNTFKNCDMIITTGGLGPTEDDLSKETICSAMEDKLIVHEPSMRKLKEYEIKSKKKMTSNNYKQGMMPSRAFVFENENGIAPGFALEKEGKVIVALPEPPREMKPMFEGKVKPFLKKFSGDNIFYKSIRLFGIEESSLETELIELIHDQSDPTIATYAKEGECTLRIASKRKTLSEAEEAVSAMVSQVAKRVGKYIYSYEDETLAEVVGRKLIEKNITIACTESCTGGLFAGALTDIPGISKVFDRGLVTYTYEAKEEELGVKKETLEMYTAESSQVAREMAEGLYAKTKCDICISVTGIAGPGGFTESISGGLMYIGLCTKGDMEVVELRTQNVNRSWNRNFGVLSMFDLVNKTIDNKW